MMLFFFRVASSLLFGSFSGHGVSL
jgi:hypothetical protein